ncbi:MAG: hypothetical protein NC094_06520 [Bacteroidales bacterium]|nr:hypothetical protein [Lachnoclostridium sp.]MCM1384801.1 hypothetical protein [Lachnoclostridium sp.]MCM1465055.1 hypothetical protein [Bacteroidales bacterium]
MDIKEKISKIVEELTKNEDLKKQFEKEPVKVIEKVIGMDLPDDVVEKVIDGVKAKIAADGISKVTGAIKNLF